MQKELKKQYKRYRRVKEEKNRYTLPDPKKNFLEDLLARSPSPTLDDESDLNESQTSSRRYSRGQSQLSNRSKNIGDSSANAEVKGPGRSSSAQPSRQNNLGLAGGPGMLNLNQVTMNQKQFDDRTSGIDHARQSA